MASAVELLRFGCADGRTIFFLFDILPSSPFEMDQLPAQRRGEGSCLSARSFSPAPVALCSYLHLSPVAPFARALTPRLKLGIFSILSSGHRWP
ncbi:hypothetical protein TEQG_08563 [Trichophyton equinum CBS 127.97]|uniref:Uncharacterized protein n=1 Tax=Trichophyton equinum (strain ATCC MYA-4606 / CBS 127.97) TaxID=559882 RepID=F2PGH4_TRIEC|nr:hypothetical protein TEQG_08563 [Trichophyton equinum CBS 127.97]